MTPGFKIHTGNFQPKETYGKKVLCRLFDSDRFICYPANDINWLTEGPRAPSQHGRIIEYKVV